MVYVHRLLNRQAEEWGNKVSVVSCDMRKWEAPEKVISLVSLICVSKHLSQGGIAIPRSYPSCISGDAYAA